jgi:hypothetical protein
VVALVMASPSELALGLEDRRVVKCDGGRCCLVGAVDGVGCRRWGAGSRVEGGEGYKIAWASS